MRVSAWNMLQLLICLLALTLSESAARNWKGRPSRSCPDTTGIITPCVVTPENCFSDAQCPRNLKCCPYGCGSICMRPGKGRFRLD
ncbi:WAP four-disulfide core domain protein 5-like isoform X1 [Oratosquilla oratoria]|uniref:WAP four-disulfide core domain protein 5-like isoform X1 n=1 Tax=Oratosquilla oratoria TaxID=337810 RepID=UPI003F76DB46